MKKRKIYFIILFLCIIFVYIFRVYSVNIDAPNLRNYKMEKINTWFDAYGGKILVDNIGIISKEEYKKELSKNNIPQNNLNKIKEDYLIEIEYKIDNIKEQNNLDITLNMDEYIFIDGLPAPYNVGENKYKYFIPLDDETYKKIKKQGYRMFLDNIKVDELEHHYIEIKNSQ